MSRGQKPRTPQHFPHMKYRARGRHRRAIAEVAQRAFFTPETQARLADIGAALGVATEHMVEAFRTAIAAIDWPLLAERLAEHRREAICALGLDRCPVCNGTGDSNGADWCGECGGTGRIDIEQEPVPPCACEPGRCADPWAPNCRPPLAEERVDPPASHRNPPPGGAGEAKAR